METVDLAKIFKNCMSKELDFTLDEIEHTEEVKRILKENINEISGN